MKDCRTEEKNKENVEEGTCEKQENPPEIQSDHFGSSVADAKRTGSMIPRLLDSTRTHDQSN